MCASYKSCILMNRHCAECFIMCLYGLNWGFSHQIIDVKLSINRSCQNIRIVFGEADVDAEISYSMAGVLVQLLPTDSFGKAELYKELHEFVFGSWHDVGCVAETDGHFLDGLFYFVLGDFALSYVEELYGAVHGGGSDLPVWTDDFGYGVSEALDGLDWRVWVWSVVPDFNCRVIAATYLYYQNWDYIRWGSNLLYSLRCWFCQCDRCIFVFVYLCCKKRCTL